ncbi:hypothetical protein [Pseudorhodoferax sp. Leaf274]|nr:hypothetical protein [Pseudorhodoferax sp. Leaf274]
MTQRIALDLGSSATGQVLPDNPGTPTLAPASLARCMLIRGAAIALA